MDGLEKAIFAGIAIRYGIPVLLVAGGLAYLGVQHQEQVRQNEKITHIFAAAGIPQDKQGIVRDVIFNQGGNCALLSGELQKPCETAKENLGVRYEAPRPVVTLNPR